MNYLTTVFLEKNTSRKLNKEFYFNQTTSCFPENFVNRTRVVFECGVGTVLEWNMILEMLNLFLTTNRDSWACYIFLCYLCNQGIKDVNFLYYRVP